MRYHLAPLFCRPWTLNGISPRLIESHYENNYGGALNRLNAISEELGSLDPATTPADVLSRLKRDETAALNSTLLHELYFASLGGDGRAVPNAMADANIRDFGSVDRWRQEFMALANALGANIVNEHRHADCLRCLGRRRACRQQAQTSLMNLRGLQTRAGQTHEPWSLLISMIV